jgi:hypothetical protein
MAETCAERIGGMRSSAHFVRRQNWLRLDAALSRARIFALALEL